MTGKDALDALKRKLGVDSTVSLAARLGMTSQALRNWSGRKQVTPRQLASLVAKAMDAATKQAHHKAIRPVIEFMAIEPTDTGRVLFDVKDDDGREHPYLAGVRRELERCHGIYIFYDSRGRALYAGKARRQTLWTEMNNAFNRARPGVQKISRVEHPLRRVQYKTSDEIERRIVKTDVPLSELASYASAYDVPDGMIESLEALLVRGFANDLLNVRMERFTAMKGRSA